MRTNYPEDYKGPKAGYSEDSEWLAVTEFQAFKWIRDNTWYYSDFDCWLVTRDLSIRSKKEQECLNAFKEMQKIVKIFDGVRL